MAVVRFAKVAASLPGTLAPDTLYLVRAGAGFDLYCSDATASIAYRSNTLTAPDVQRLLRGVQPPPGLIIPYYIYPNDPFSDATVRRLLNFIRANADVPVLVIVNPASGPGTSQDINYDRFIGLLRAAGARMLGYVSTSYAGRTQAQIQADIDAWGTLYRRIDGIFLDEMPSSATSSNLALYSALTSYAHAKGYYPVVTNPGTPVVSDFYAYGCGDIIMYLESAGYPDSTTLAQEFIGGSGFDVPPAHKAAIAYGVPMDAQSIKTMRDWASWVYVTDASASAPFASLPTYLEALPQLLRQPVLSSAYPKRSATPKIAGDVNGTALTTLALTAARQYFVPLVVPRAVTLTGLRISVTTAAAGTASIGIYGNAVVSGNDAPGSLLASVTGLNTGTTGDKTGTLSYTLQPGQLYWASLIASAAATVRALAVGSVQVALGRTANNTTAISCLYAAGSGSTLPATAPTALTDGTGSIPAIYLLE